MVKDDLRELAQIACQELIAARFQSDELPSADRGVRISGGTIHKRGFSVETCVKYSVISAFTLPPPLVQPPASGVCSRRLSHKFKMAEFLTG